MIPTLPNPEIIREIPMTSKPLFDCLASPESRAGDGVGTCSLVDIVDDTWGGRSVGTREGDLGTIGQSQFRLSSYTYTLFTASVTYEGPVALPPPVTVIWKQEG